MQAEDLLKSGDLDGALVALQDLVRGDASNPELRIFLFQLLSVRGEWKRAITQLKVSAELDKLAIPMAQTYREGIICEVYREKVFVGEKDPLIFGEPQEWTASKGRGMPRKQPRSGLGHLMRLQPYLERLMAMHSLGSPMLICVSGQC